MSPNTFVIATKQPSLSRRYWLCKSGIADWYRLTGEPRYAAEFPSIEEAEKARDAHHARVGVASWNIAVRARR
jgi:hypothetical protein